MTIHGITDRGRLAERVPTVSVSIDGRPPAGGRRGARPRGDLRLGRRLLRDRAHRAARQGRGRRRPAPRPRPLQHRRRGGPDARGARADRRSERRHRVDPARAWRGRSTRPSCAGSSGCGSATRSPRTPATSTASSPRCRPDCVYEIVPTGQRWEGHAGARAFYTELFGAFPDNAFALSEIVIGPQGAFEVATLTGTNPGPWAGVAAVRPGRLARGPHPLPVGPRHGAVHRGADLVRPRDAAAADRDLRPVASARVGAPIIDPGRHPTGHSRGDSHMT